MGEGPVSDLVVRLSFHTRLRRGVVADKSVRWSHLPPLCISRGLSGAEASPVVCCRLSSSVVVIAASVSRCSSSARARLAAFARAVRTSFAPLSRLSRPVSPISSLKGEAGKISYSSATLRPFFSRAPPLRPDMPPPQAAESRAPPRAQADQRPWNLRDGQERVSSLSSDSSAGRTAGVWLTLGARRLGSPEEG